MPRRSRDTSVYANGHRSVRAGSRFTRAGRPILSSLVAGVAALAVGAAIAYKASAVSSFVLLAVVVALSMRQPMPLYAAFLYLGVFKAAPAVQALPVDATAVTAIALVCVCGYRWLQRRTQPLPAGLVGLILLISTLMLLSLSWTPSGAYGEQKLLQFVTLTTLATLAPFFLVQGPGDVRLFLVTVVVLAVAIMLGVLFSSSAGSGRLSFGPTRDTIASGRLLCSGAIVLLFMPVGRVSLRWLTTCIGIILFLVALGVGSRGPLLAFVLAALVVGVARIVTSPRQLIPAIGVVLALGFAATSVSLPEISRERLDVGESVGATLQSEHRASFYKTAVDLTMQHPFRGAGVGGYASVGFQTSEAGTIYPHNVFLELSSELGVASAIALLLALIVVFARVFPLVGSAKTPGGELAPPVVALFVFALLAAQFSSDINGNRPFWGMLGLAWLVSYSFAGASASKWRNRYIGAAGLSERPVFIRRGSAATGRRNCGVRRPSSVRLRQRGAQRP